MTKSIDEKFKRRASVGVELIEEAVIEAIKKYPSPARLWNSDHEREIAKIVGISPELCSGITSRLGGLEGKGKIKRLSPKKGWRVNEDG